MYLINSHNRLVNAILHLILVPRPHRVAFGNSASPPPRGSTYKPGLGRPRLVRLPNGMLRYDWYDMA